MGGGVIVVMGGGGGGVVSFLSGLCACWDSCLCRGFMLSLEWCCFFQYPAFASGGACVLT